MKTCASYIGKTGGGRLQLWYVLNLPAQSAWGRTSAVPAAVLHLQLQFQGKRMTKASYIGKTYDHSQARVGLGRLSQDHPLTILCTEPSKVAQYAFAKLQAAAMARVFCAVSAQHAVRPGLKGTADTPIGLLIPPIAGPPLGAPRLAAQYCIPITLPTQDPLSLLLPHGPIKPLSPPSNCKVRADIGPSSPPGPPLPLPLASSAFDTKGGTKPPLPAAQAPPGPMPPPRPPLGRVRPARGAWLGPCVGAHEERGCCETE